MKRILIILFLLICIFFQYAFGQTINNLYYSLDIPYGFDTSIDEFRNLTKKEKDELFNSFQKKDSTVFGEYGLKIDIWDPDKNYFKIVTKGDGSMGFGEIEVLFWKNDTITIVGIHIDYAVMPIAQIDFMKFIGNAPGRYVGLTDIIPSLEVENYKDFFAINNTNSEEINNCISDIKRRIKDNMLLSGDILDCSFSNIKHNEISIGINCYDLLELSQETYTKYGKKLIFTWNMEKGIFELDQ